MSLCASVCACVFTLRICATAHFGTLQFTIHFFFFFFFHCHHFFAALMHEHVGNNKIVARYDRIRITILYAS